MLVALQDAVAAEVVRQSSAYLQKLAAVVVLPRRLAHQRMPVAAAVMVAGQHFGILRTPVVVMVVASEIRPADGQVEHFHIVRG